MQRQAGKGYVHGYETREGDRRRGRELRRPGPPPGLARERLAYLVRFQHPEKTVPGLSPAASASALGLGPEEYEKIREGFFGAAAAAAAELLEEEAVTRAADALPFRAGSTVVGLGDSITDDDGSWFEILRELWTLRRPREPLRLINAGVCGETTAQILARFLEAAAYRPDWIVVLAGTNDARTLGAAPGKTLVGLSETEANFAEIRRLARTRTRARTVWLTPPPVIEDLPGVHWALGPLEIHWRNRDVAAVADLVRRLPETVVDVRPGFGDPPDPGLFQDDGVHPSPEGQKVIVRALVEGLAAAGGGEER
ncbi:MAG TPA: GDSL-type esterase/lipase family protein [bacterium]|nr:GDSL-type esterase/lipase family protein [bacterium]